MRYLKENKNAKITIYIKRGFNSWGRFIEIYAQDNDDSRVFGNYKEQCYYGYSLNETIKLYRQENGLKGKHCDIVEFN